jgi:8-oxo-dGTP pyrophosphatase MutT (NUDIX family)
MPHDPGEELVDVIDDEGRTIDTVTRREVRQHRLPHRCVYVLVFNRKGELFIHLRTPTKDVYPSYWDVCVGGVLSAGESFDLGARREIAEEVGLDLDPEPLFLFRYSDSSSVVLGMVYRVVHEGPFRLQPEEIVRGEFVPPQEVAIRAAKAPFCPDALSVFMEYQRRFPSS